MVHHLIIGTAGHIDHGKTTLIKALTNTDTDRLKEEKKRGISIDIGFAHIRLPNGCIAGIVDVPGHERFIKNMLAGATGMDMVMLVVAADEGVMPQTIEHLQILTLLNVEHGLVVLTKTDMVDEEILELAVMEIRDVLKGTFLEDCPILPVSSTTGAGLKELLVEMDNIANTVEPKDFESPPVMPIDRVFSMQGFGTVVTGTLSLGQLKCDDIVEIVPAGQSSRIRGLQVHGVETETADAGQRVAVNLAGIKKEAVKRGDLISAPGFIIPTTTIDVYLVVLGTAKRSIKNTQRLRVYIGAKEVLARVSVIGMRSIEQGQFGWARLRLEEPVGALAGEPFVVRSYSPAVTIGGGLILDTNPLHKRLSNTDIVNYLRILYSGISEEILELIVSEIGKGVQTKEELRRNFGRRKEFEKKLNRCIENGKIEEITAGGVKYYINSVYSNKLQQTITDALSLFHENYPLKKGMGQDELRSAVQMDSILFEYVLNKLLLNKKVKRDQQYISLYDFYIKMTRRQEQVIEKIYTKLKDSGFVPTSHQELELLSGLTRTDFKDLILTAVHTKDIIRVNDELYLYNENHGIIKQKLIGFVNSKGSITVAEFRDLIGISRKYALAILEHFDNIKLTKRVGDSRILRNT